MPTAKKVVSRPERQKAEAEREAASKARTRAMLKQMAG